MYSLAHVVNSIIRRSIDEGIKLSPMKLQKILYFWYAEYYISTNMPLFNNRFEAWRYGPAIPDVHFMLENSSYKYMVDYSGNVYYLDVKHELKNSFDKVWKLYSHKSGIELSMQTQKYGTAWHKAWTKGERFLNDQDVKSKT